MKSAGAAQVAIVLLLIASAASCEVAREYSTKVFKPAIPQKQPDSISTALKFMHFDSENASDSIDLKTFANKEFPENDKIQVVKDTSKTEVVIVDDKKILREQRVEAIKPGTTRTRKVRQ
ncbi:MAG TPA: hypothetical protein VFH08_14320 [Chitinophagaceae bacterium]|nr:hypothetical protein [Chitinophagaceae bacterium]